MTTPIPSALQIMQDLAARRASGSSIGETMGLIATAAEHGKVVLQASGVRIVQAPQPAWDMKRPCLIVQTCLGAATRIGCCPISIKCEV